MSSSQAASSSSTSAAESEAALYKLLPRRHEPQDWKIVCEQQVWSPVKKKAFCDLLAILEQVGSQTGASVGFAIARLALMSRGARAVGGGGRGKPCFSLPGCTS